MLSEEEVRAYTRTWTLPVAGQIYVDATRSSEPSRRVGGRRTRNTPIRFASQRMGRVIQAESNTVEGLFVRDWEYAQRVNPELWDQPLAVPLVITNRVGRRQRITYTPDYLVVRPARPGVVECKSEAEIAQLVRERPDDWRCEDGRYRYVPAADFFADLGLDHEVWIPDACGALRASNIDLLLAARWAPLPGDAHCWRLRICTYLASKTIASLSTLSDALHLPNAMMVLRGIDEGWLYAPLDQFLLSRPHDALFALDQERFEQGREALALWRTSHPGTRSSSSVPDTGKAVVMLQRQQALLCKPASAQPPRTLGRWRSQLRAKGGNAHALLPRDRPGNRMPRLTEEQETFLQESILRHHATATALSSRASHIQYQLDFEEKQAAGVFKTGEFAVSLPTYRARLKKLEQEHLARARGGQRAAHAAAEPVDRDRCAAPACRPFEIAHADHYLGDRALLLRLSGGRRWSARPWISILRDSTDEVLAMALGFRAPSTSVLSELLRDCVRRHGRLPSTIMSDGGSDFQSVFYEATLASYGVHKMDRPSGAPRFGGELERLFGTLKTRLLWNRPGSTRNNACNRAVSPSHRGHYLAEQELIDHYHELDEAIFGQLNTHLRGERLTSPDITAAQGLALYPMSGVEVAYDEQFLIATSINAPRKSYKVDRSRGIQVLDRWFWSPQLARFDHSNVEARLDPWDEHLTYAYLDGTWVSCRSRGAAPYENRDLVAVMAKTILRLDGRAEHAQAKSASDLALARHLRERERTLAAEATVATPPPADQTEANDTLSGDFPTFNILWSE